MSKAPFTNRLSQETSPYLLQHARNPVDWYPWGADALAKALKEQKPIFLSIGYSACHWCHVMERESFEDEQTAKVMNEHFINIKVDREERQDLDHIYMSAVQVMTQHGGWPMSVFLTPDLQPFYGGTYFPPEDRTGMPSFKKTLLGVANAWNTRKDEVLKSAAQLSQALIEINQTPAEKSQQPLSLSLVDKAIDAISHNFDPTHGGFGSAPKFFHSTNLRLCLRHWKRTKSADSLHIVEKTLEELSRGGIYDHLGGGFHRYSTDQYWLVPHFEKMLYDNALLTELYLEAFQATKNPNWARIARETLNYVLREMTSADGGFFSTQDADSEGHEGKFYVWTKEEIHRLLDNDVATLFCKVYEVRESGNWEGTNILHLEKSLKEYAKELQVDEASLEDTLALAHRKLFEARSRRISPFRDEKVLTNWNGLMIHSMALGYQVLGDERYLKAARSAAEFVISKLWGESEGLLHCYKDRRSRFSGYLDDYADFAFGLLSLYESDFDERWLKAALELADTMVEQFWDDTTRNFYYTAKNHEKLITRPKDTYDGATPSGTSMAITILARLGRLTQNQGYLSKVQEALKGSYSLMQKSPTAVGQLFIATDMLLNQPMEIVVAPGKEEEEKETALQKIRTPFLPSKVIALQKPGVEEMIPLLQKKTAIDGRTTIYLCENFTCQRPITDLQELERELGKR